MAAPSMAAALAASLPAPQAAPTPAAPIYEAIPASMSKAIDIEAEIPLTCVQLDGIVRNFVDRLPLISHDLPMNGSTTSAFKIPCWAAIDVILTFESQVITKILKHSREAFSTTAHGLLLGLDLDGILEVSNSFALPNHNNDDDEKATKSIGEVPVAISTDYKH
jgi:translation initiation factor 3 subunit H